MMIPTTRLTLLLVFPLVLGLCILGDPSLLWPMLATDAAILVLAGADALLGRHALVRVDRNAPLVFSVGRQNRVQITLRSRSRRKLVVWCKDDLFDGAETTDLPLRVELAGNSIATVAYNLRPTRRGDYALGDHFVRYATPLGLWQRQQRISANLPLRVYPDVTQVRTFDLLAKQDRQYALVRAARLRGGESEFERLREYLRDDEFRHIDWKATARRQKIISREFQIERNQNLFFLVDCGRLMTAETLGLSHMDHALNALLMVSHVAARTGDQVGLLAFDKKVRAFLAPAGGARATTRVIQASYSLHADLTESNYDAAFDALMVRLRKRSLVVLFTQVIDEASAKVLEKRMRQLAPRHLPLCVLFRDRELDAQVSGKKIAVEDSPSDLYDRAAAADLLTWRKRVVRRLEAGGSLVLDVAPDALTPSLVKRYLEVKARQLL